MNTRAALRRLRQPWLVAFDSLVMCRLPAARPDPRRVLAVRLDAIGDFVLWLDAARALRRLYPPPDFHITLLGNQAWTSLAERLPCFDEVWPLDGRRFHQSPTYRSRILSQVRAAGFSIAIQPTYTRETCNGDAIIRATGAPRRIGFGRSAPDARLWGDRWYTQLIPARSGTLMELLRNAEFARWIGVSDFRARLPELPAGWPLPASVAGLDYFILVLGASMDVKRWPPGSFAQAAERLRRETGWSAVLCGGPGETSLGLSFEQLAPGLPLVNLIGKTSLNELVAVVKGARLVISNDTGPVHIAAAVGTPAVCIVGGGHFGRFLPYAVEAEAEADAQQAPSAGSPRRSHAPAAVHYPMPCYGCGWHCIYRPPRGQPAPCVSQVSVETVWQAIRPHLPRRDPPQSTAG